MSKGSERLIVRIPADLMNAIEGYVQARYPAHKLSSWSLSVFVRDAIREKIQHYRRSLKSRHKRNGQTVDNDSVDLGSLPPPPDEASGTIPLED